MASGYWEHFEHDADIGVRGVGDSLAEAFEHTAEAVTAVITTLADVNDEQAIEIHCQAPDRELLLADWINALIFEMATRKMLFRRFDVSIKGDVLKGVAWGETVDIERHDPSVEIKGATYTELKVERQQDETWLAQCVVDV